MAISIKKIIQMKTWFYSQAENLYNSDTYTLYVHDKSDVYFAFGRFNREVRTLLLVGWIEKSVPCFQ